MRSRLITSLLFVCAAAAVACDATERATQPVPPVPFAPGELQFASTRFTTKIDPLTEGDSVQLKAVAIDTLGAEIPVPYTVTYVSHAPSVATVSETGLVRATASGYADIWATIVIGHTEKSNGARAYVFTAVAPDSIVFTSGKHGWEPSQAQVAAGGTVEWQIGAVDWAGMPATQVYLVNEQGAVLDSIDVKTGSAIRRFESHGLFHYCSGGCWDPPDWGVIYVR